MRADGRCTGKGRAGAVAVAASKPTFRQRVLTLTVELTARCKVADVARLVAAFAEMTPPALATTFVTQVCINSPRHRLCACT